MYEMEGKFKRPYNYSGYILIFFLSVYPLASAAKLTIVYYSMELFFFFIASAVVLLRPRPICEIAVKNSLPIFSFFTVLILSSIWAKQPTYTFLKATTLLAFLWLYYLSHILFLNNKLRWFYRLQISASIISFALIFYIFVSYGRVRAYSSEMMENFAHVSNVASAVSVVCFPYLLYIFKTKKMNRFIVGFCMVFTVLTITLSESRAGILLLLFAIIASNALFAKSVIGFFGKTLKLLFVPGIIILALVITPTYREIVLSPMEKISNSILFSGPSAKNQDEIGVDYMRVLMFEEAIWMIREDPYLGVGYAGFGKHMEDKYGIYKISHNLFVTAWVEGGLPGMAALCWLLLSSYMRLFSAYFRLRSQSREKALFAGVTLISLTILVIHGFFRPQLQNPMFYPVLAISFAFRKRHSLLFDISTNSKQFFILQRRGKVVN